METGHWLMQILYNACIVLIANSYVFKEPVLITGRFSFYGRIKSNQYIYHEIAQEIIMNVEIIEELTEASKNGTVYSQRLFRRSTKLNLWFRL
jgi:hypothetical protein